MQHTRDARRMRRRMVVAILALVALTATAGSAALAPRPADAERVYTVAQVNAGLARNPATWIGRVVRVRGRAIIPVDHGTVRCCATLLVDPAAPAQRITLVWRSVSPWLTFLLRLPVIQAFVAPRVGGTGVYLVRLTRVARSGPAPGLPNYFPYTGETVVVSDDRAELVNSLH